MWPVYNGNNLRHSAQHKLIIEQLFGQSSILNINQNLFIFVTFREKMKAPTVFIKRKIFPHETPSWNIAELANILIKYVTK